MHASHPLRPLSNLDASFLHLETTRTPMHLVGMFIFQNRRGQFMDAAGFREHVRVRVNRHRIMRERLIQSTLGFGKLWWAEDVEFDLEDHLHFVESDGPLDQALLAKLSENFLRPLLDRNRPLWELLFVSEKGSGAGNAQFAVVLKVHHAACDGLSAKNLIASLFDGFGVVAESEELPLVERGMVPALPPSIWQVAARDLEEWRGVAARSVNLVKNASWCAMRSIQMRWHSAYSQPAFFAAPPSPFNVAIGEDRVRFSVELSLPILKAIREQRPELTINDIVLAICGGGFRRYFQSVGKKQCRALVGFAPISKRTSDDTLNGGNQVSGMLLELGNDIRDPLKRLQRVHENAAQAKRFNREIPFERLLDDLPTSLLAGYLRALAKGRLAERMPPIFNTVITNIAMLPPSFHLAGAPLVSFSTYAPISDAMALSIVVLTQGDTTVLGVTTTQEAVKHPARFAEAMRYAQQDLAKACGVSWTPERALAYAEIA
ncbi:Conserved hypothetical protein [gamma proteobacterium HdN1]|nr:Conserved hypothetical protein [gamma proteobacterium HdN1]